MEAFVNYIASSHESAGSLEPFETAFLTDNKLYFDVRDVEVKRRSEYHSVSDKLRVIIKKFVRNYDFGCSDWREFQEFKKLRDDLVHPREDEDSISLSSYESRVRSGLRGIIAVMDSVCSGMWGRRLRRRLRDLMPDE